MNMITMTAPPSTSLESSLASTPIFGAMEPVELRLFASMARRRTLVKGEIIFSENAPADAFYIMERGRVRLYRTGHDGHAHVIHHVAPGQSFAEAAVFGMARFPATAEAADNSTVIVIPAAPFLKRLRERPDLYERVIISLSMWMHTLLDRVNELTAGSAAGRLAHYLVRQPATNAGSAVIIQLQIPKREIAARLSIAPETLSRILHDWEELKIIISRPKGIEVLDLARLERIADNI
ncbi:MAG: Crp/Fnr family transcriptional regulator [Planctomycetes bacterium]|nr:Crp/Fnr family transcriptional regulator [Planctomycetota bacterium]